MDIEQLFEENCFLPCIGEIETKPVRKDLDTLLKELNVIENNLEEIKARQQNLAQLAIRHQST